MKFDPYFHGRVWSNTLNNYAYIDAQRGEISQNRHFVFGFTTLPPILTAKYKTGGLIMVIFVISN